MKSVFQNYGSAAAVGGDVHTLNITLVFVLNIEITYRICDVCVHDGNLNNFEP